MIENILGLGASLTLYAAVLVIVVVAGTFMAHCKYDDGVVGNAFLGGTLLFGGLVLVEATSIRYEVAPELALFLASLACFMCWALLRFLRRMRILRDLERKDPEATIPERLPYAQDDVT